MRINSKVKGILVILIIGILTYVAAAGLPFAGIPSAAQMRFGVDIKGGVNATLYPDVTAGQSVSDDDLNSAKSIIDKRLESQGIFDKYVNVDKAAKRIIIEIPWNPQDTDRNPQKTISAIGETALLTFQEVDTTKLDEKGNPLPTGKIVIEGRNVTEAKPAVNNDTGGMVVQLKLDKEGAEKFSEATGRLVGQPIAIFMDDIFISAPRVDEQIPNGEAVITLGGNSEETVNEAKDLADTINAGSLPFKLVSKQVNSISALLGEGAMKVMIQAGIIAFLLVCLFMLLIYRLPGIVADIALFGLVVAQLIVLSIFKISLTLPGIAGIILSIGMGVDANVIIFERIKEELRSGKTLKASIDLGFKRAFVAIFDGNITTLIVAAILYWLGTGPIKGFAVTLFLGTVLSFLTAVWASKILVQATSELSISKHHWLYGIKEGKANA